MQIPFQKIENELTQTKGINLHILRLDTLDFFAGGNKFFKLKYNLEEVKQQGYKQIVTFGGAWSNHLAACASVINKQLSVIAIIRGEEPKQLSDTLKFCEEKGMELHFVSREEYRKKDTEGFITELKNKFGDFYLLPEGGSNELAVKGCSEIANYIPIDFDVVCCPVGSGGTLAGIISSLKPHQQAIGFSALKGATDLQERIENLLPKNTHHSSFKIIHDYHFGGFAKTTPELLSFKKNFETEFDFELDYIYTSKMLYGIFDLMQKKHFKPNTSLVAIHTGGLQGNKGFE